MILSGFYRSSNGIADPVDGGDCQVVGTVAIAGTPDVPVERVVYLMEYLSKRVVRTTVSAPLTGEYAFRWVHAGPWTVIADDPTGQYNSVIAANRTGEVI